MPDTSSPYAFLKELISRWPNVGQDDVTLAQSLGLGQVATVLANALAGSNAFPSSAAEKQALTVIKDIFSNTPVGQTPPGPNLPPDQILPGYNPQPDQDDGTINVANFEEALLELAKLSLANQINSTRSGVGGGLLQHLTALQQNPYSIVPALQAYKAAGAGPIATTAGQGPSPYGAMVDQLIKGLGNFSLVGEFPGAGGSTGDQGGGGQDNGGSTDQGGQGETVRNQDGTINWQATLGNALSRSQAPGGNPAISSALTGGSVPWVNIQNQQMPDPSTFVPEDVLARWPEYWAGSHGAWQGMPSYQLNWQRDPEAQGGYRWVGPGPDPRSPEGKDYNYFQSPFDASGNLINPIQYGKGYEPGAPRPPRTTDILDLYGWTPGSNVFGSGPQYQFRTPQATPEYQDWLRQYNAWKAGQTTTTPVDRLGNPVEARTGTPTTNIGAKDISSQIDIVDAFKKSGGSSILELQKLLVS